MLFQFDQLGALWFHVTVLFRIWKFISHCFASNVLMLKSLPDTHCVTNASHEAQCHFTNQCSSYVSGHFYNFNHSIFLHLVDRLIWPEAASRELPDPTRRRRSSYRSQ